MLNEDIIKKAKTEGLPLRLVYFLCQWGFAFDCSIIPAFGFQESADSEEQFNSAVSFLVETEKKWQDAVTSNKTTMDFIDFFEQESKNNMITLPMFFNETMRKGETDGLYNIK